MSTSISPTLLTAQLTRSQPAQRGVRAEVRTSDIAILTRRLARGEDAAFREFHAKYFDRLYRFLLVVTRGQEQEAQESLQETLLRLVRYVREFEEEDAFWCWLKAVARSAARDGGRKQTRYAALLRRFALFSSSDLTPQIRSEDSRLGMLLTECLEELTLEDRRLLEGKYLEGATVRELSGFSALTEKAVESRLARLRRQVREQLLRRLNEP